jgi:hypothetical protein
MVGCKPWATDGGWNTEPSVDAIFTIGHSVNKRGALLIAVAALDAMPSPLFADALLASRQEPIALDLLAQLHQHSQQVLVSLRDATQTKVK